MQAARAAETDEQEFGWVEAPVDRDAADGFDHVFVGDADDALRGGLDVEAYRFRESGHGLAGEIDVEFEAAGQRRARRQPAEQQIGVGDGRSGAALAVADRSRVRASRLRAHLQHAAAVDIGDGAAARADGMHVHHGHGDGKLAEPAFAGDADGSVEQGDVGGSPAHVETDQLALSDLAAQICHRRQPSRGSGEQQVHRGVRRLAGAHGFAARLHDLQRGARGKMIQTRLQTAQITAHDRPEKGIQPSRHAALVFLVFGQHPRRAGNEHFGQGFAQGLLDGFLVARVEKREQQIDRHRFRFQFAQLRGQRSQVVRRQRVYGLPIRTNPAAGFQAKLFRHRRR